MAYDGYHALRVAVDAGVAYAIIDHPPINLLDLVLLGDLDRLSHELADDDGIRVLVLASANPEFFIAHADVSLIEQLPTEVKTGQRELGFFHAMVERFRTLPQATIAKIEGRTRGGGSELVLVPRSALSSSVSLDASRPFLRVPCAEQRKPSPRRNHRPCPGSSSRSSASRAASVIPRHAVACECSLKPAVRLATSRSTSKTCSRAWSAPRLRFD